MQTFLILLFVFTVHSQLLPRHEYLDRLAEKRQFPKAIAMARESIYDAIDDMQESNQMNAFIALDLLGCYKIQPVREEIERDLGYTVILTDDEESCKVVLYV